MLDKSLPYVLILMRLPKERLAQLPPVKLPEGYSMTTYQEGRMNDWAKVQTSVLEFPNEDKAKAYFAKEFMPREKELPNRMCFILDPNGEPVADATAWSDKGFNWLHWVATRPTHQGMGIGKAVVLAALSRFPAMGCEDDVYLYTQTWSHTAVGMYSRVGFRMQSVDPSTGKELPLQRALEMLSWRLPPEQMQKLKDEAE